MTQINPNQLEFAKNRTAIFEHFFQIEIEKGATSTHLAFLDRGINHSPFQTEIEQYSSYLKQQPMRFRAYPDLGQLPTIYTQGLDFLHQDIQEACICLGRWHEGRIEGLWLGRNALHNTQFWSSTKVIPMLNILSQINHQYPQSSTQSWVIRDPDHSQINIPFDQTIEDIITYQKLLGTSNALAAMLKRFETRLQLEQWLKIITGNWELEFQGDYGEAAFIKYPEVYDTLKNKVLLQAVRETRQGNNFVSAYDLTRIISMIGWHHHLTPECRFPHLTEPDLRCIITALGKDTARFIDAAFNVLGLENIIQSPVILSKMGHGPSRLRNTIETTYMAFVQFIDPLPKSQGKSATIRSLALTLRGAIPILDLDNFEQEAIHLDARIAAEVTEIIRRIITQEIEEIA
ncbi:MAG: hypothetical protein WBA13_07970 [Microcoleaceae cyanobacterium]